MSGLQKCLAADADLEEFRHLKKLYATSGIGLFTGLGVSAASGLPNWDTITRHVMREIDGGEQIYLYLKRKGATFQAILTWANEVLGYRFAESLRRALYNPKTFDLSLWTHERGAKFRDEVRSKNSTLAAVGALTAKIDSGIVVQNPRVRAILTTNVDTLLRNYTEKAFGVRILRSVERAAASPIPGRTNIYYLHGMIRYDGKTQRSKEASDKLIFTDLQYHTAYRDISSIFTYTPLFLFREYPFLFIGTAMTDDNVRRLLYWSKAEITQAEREEGKPSRGGRRMHYALLEAPKKTSDRDVISALLRPVRVAPIWYRKHSDVPTLLRDLYDDDDQWDGLYGGRLGNRRPS